MKERKILIRNIAEGDRIYDEMKKAMLSVSPTIGSLVSMNYALSKLMANYKLAMAKIDINVEDYIRFKNAESNGKAFNQFIKKYECVRMPDTEASTLDEMMKSFQEEDTQTSEAFSNLQYTLVVNDKTGEFTLQLNGKDIFSGIEGQVSIVRLLKSMNIAYAMVDANQANVSEDGSESEKADGVE